MSVSKETLEFLEGKWRSWYRNLDVNKDGIVSREDYKASMGAYEQYYKDKVDAKTMERLRKAFKAYWDEVILGKFAQKDEVAEDDFITSLIKQYKENREDFHKTARYMFEEIIGATDVDGNGMVSFEEFYTIFAAFGHSDERILKIMFNDYNPNNNNEIILRDMIESWIDILIGEDPKKKNVVISAFTEGAEPGKNTM